MTEENANLTGSQQSEEEPTTTLQHLRKGLEETRQRLTTMANSHRSLAKGERRWRLASLVLAIVVVAGLAYTFVRFGTEVEKSELRERKLAEVRSTAADALAKASEARDTLAALAKQAKDEQAMATPANVSAVPASQPVAPPASQPSATTPPAPTPTTSPLPASILSGILLPSCKQAIKACAEELGKKVKPQPSPAEAREACQSQYAAGKNCR